MANLNFDDLRAIGKFQAEAFNWTAIVSATCLTAIAAEATSYSQQSLESGRAHLEKLLRVQKIEDLIQLQSELYRSAYCDLFVRASRVGSLCSDLTEEAFVPAQRPAYSNNDSGPCLIEHKSERGARNWASPIEWARFLLTRQSRGQRM